jgi:hypothetical protein
MNLENSKLQAIGVLIVLGVGVYGVGSLFSRSATKTGKPWLNSTLDTTPKSPDGVKTTQASLVDNDVSKTVLWQNFISEFGTKLSARFTPQGSLYSISGIPGDGSAYAVGFDPSQPEQAVRRAKDILSKASKLIGISSIAGFEDPSVKTGKFSAQVYFQQKMAGVSLAPGGVVKIDLGPKGELVGLHSSYVDGLNVEGGFVISKDEAATIAVRALSLVDPKPTKADGGRKIIWTPRSRQEGIPSYEFSVTGFNVVVSAVDGKILYKRDRRQF